MPIYIKHEESNATITRIAEDSWSLPEQIEALEVWLHQNQEKLEPSAYIVDIGFSIRENACGGGAILSPYSMAIMGKLGMKLYLSEYAD